MLFILEEETKLSTISLCFHLTLFHDPGCIHQFVDFFILLFICDILYCLLFYCHSVYFNLLCLDLISTIPEIQCYIDAIVSRCLLRFFSPFYSCNFVIYWRMLKYPDFCSFLLYWPFLFIAFWKQIVIILVNKN